MLLDSQENGSTVIGQDSQSFLKEKVRNIKSEWGGRNFLKGKACSYLPVYPKDMMLIKQNKDVH